MDDRTLRRLARDRPPLTPELHLPNDFYGYAHVLKRWAGLPAWRSLPVVVEHGVPLQDSIWHVDRESILPTLLTINRSRVRLYEAIAAPGRVAEAIGPPIAYARRPGEPFAPPVPPDGPVLAFPAHSSHYAQARFDAERFAGELAAIARDRSVRVCLYWRDVLDGAAAPYRRRGLECVTAGHIHDRGFLPRLRRLLSESSEVVTNEMGTHVIYGVLLGRPTWIIPQEITYHDDREDAPTFTAPLADEVAALFGERRTDLSPDQAELVAEVAGRRHERTPADLARLFAEAQARLRGAVPRSTRAEARARVTAHVAKDALRLIRAPRGRASR